MTTLEDENRATHTYEYDEGLFNLLRAVRSSIAKEQKIPAYCIFTDVTLIEMATMLPCTPEEMSLVFGVGDVKLQKYGQRFIDAIKDYKLKMEANGYSFPELKDRLLPQTLPEELTLVTRQAQGFAAVDNFDEIKSLLEDRLRIYQNIVYTGESLREAKFDKASLNKLKKSIDQKRKEIKKTCLLPYETLEPKFKELLAMVNEPLSLIDAFIGDMEDVRRDSKCAEIKMFFDLHSAPLGKLADYVFASKGFYDSKWENATVKAKTWQAELIQKIKITVDNIELIKKMAPDNASALIAKYLERCDMNDVHRYFATLKQTADTISANEDSDCTPKWTHADVTEQSHITCVVLKVTGQSHQILSAISEMRKCGLACEIVVNADL